MWCIFNDSINILSRDDKHGAHNLQPWLFQEFKDAVNDCKHMDVYFQVTGNLRGGKYYEKEFDNKRKGKK